MNTLLLAAAAQDVQLNPARLILAAVIGLIILLVLIIKFKIQAMISIFNRSRGDWLNRRNAVFTYY